MGFLFTSILLSVGLTVLLNLWLRRSAFRTRERLRPGPYVYDEEADTWVSAPRARSDAGVPPRPDLPGNSS
jgi:hypothetical protein